MDWGFQNKGFLKTIRNRNTMYKIYLLKLERNCDYVSE